MNNKMPIMISKIALVASAAFFSSLVVFNNLVDYQSNFLFVMPVMSMDTTGNELQAQWRSFSSPWLWHCVYGLTLGVVLWFVTFMGVSGEWFLAWQSKAWNGIQPGFRVACLFLLILIYVTQPNDSRV